METQIQVRGLTKHYGDKTVVNNISFDVTPGRVTGFVGPNGAGKSTTMKMMVGLARAHSGTVAYDGVPYRSLQNPAQVMGVVLDASANHAGRKGRNHLRVLAAQASVPASRVDECLARVGLADAADTRTKGYSLGMTQRLALAGAMLGNPQILMLDEPFNGLDPEGIRWLRGFLTDFASQGGTVFVSSHLISELAQFADDLVVIGAGKLLANDTVQAITGDIDAVVVESPELGELLRLVPNHETKRVGTDQVQISGITRADIAQLALEHRIAIHGLSDAVSDLEQTLLELTADSAQYAAA